MNTSVRPATGGRGLRYLSLATTAIFLFGLMASPVAAASAPPSAQVQAVNASSGSTVPSATPEPAASAKTFATGSLIIPMDTGGAPSNQNLGMWKAYGLLYKLLQNGISVSWAILETKSATTDIDFNVSSVKDKRTNSASTARDYTGGPFIIDSADAAAALPIITAWWAANGGQPNVHEALAGFNADVNVILRSAPRIANEAVNAGITLAYYNAAGIPDANGKPWTSTSPGILTEAQIAAGGLFLQGSVCLQRKYDVFVTPHNSGYSYSLSDPTNLGTKTYSQLDTFVQQGGGWTALCHSILSNENFIRDLTVNGSAAVKALFKTSLPGGQPGGFLTSSGFTTIDNTAGSWMIDTANAGLPTAQLVPTGVAQGLPGGSVQTWPSTGNPGAPAYWPSTERVGYFDTAGVDHDNIIAGVYHNGTGAGKLTYIGGHSFATALPYSANFEAPYLRAFYNSLFFNGSAVAKVDLTYSPTTYPQNGTGLLTASIANTGASIATSTDNVSVTLSPGFEYVATTFGPVPVVSGVPLTGQTLTWGNALGSIAGGQTAATFQVSVPSSVSATAGTKQFGQFHATYGDIFGEGFTADVCRDITVSPTPAPSLTKTPATQGPVAAGSPVTWTLAYGNTGANVLENSVLQDILPPGFSFVSGSPAPTLVIPGSQTIVRWNLGTLAPGSSGSVTLTARAGAITNGTGDPLKQTFTNHATLAGTDTGGNPYTATASATVVVQVLDLNLGKTVDTGFIATLPGTVNYTLTPRSSSNDLLENVRVIDPVPAGVTSLAAGQGGTVGAYTTPPSGPQIPAVPGVDGNYLTAMTVGSSFVTQGGSVNVTLNVKFNASVPNVSPGDLSISGGSATCTGPTPASGTVPNGGSGQDFVWSCTLNDLGEYIFTAGADDGGANSWPEASSASVLSAAGGGTNVVTWNLGSNTAAVPGQTITSGYTAGIFGFRGATTNTFQKYDLSSSAWSARANALTNVAKGGSLTTDGAGTIYGLAGNSNAFWAHDIATNVWTAKANAPATLNEGGALVYLKVGATEYVYAFMGNGNTFRRYDVAANTWSSMASAPATVKGGGALTTDGTDIYATAGGKSTAFWRYNVGLNTWTALTAVPSKVGWGGSLARIGAFIYALSGDGGAGSTKKGLYRYSIAGNTWTPMANAPGDVKNGGALTTDGTNLYAFQGATTAFWRYNVSGNTWTVLSAFAAATGQGGALVYSPGVDPQGRFSSLTASRSLVVTGDPVEVTFTLSSTAAVNNVAPAALTVTPTSGASCSSLTGPTLTSADDDIASIGDPVTYKWTCIVAAGANPGSLTFSDSASGAGPVAFPAATSNSVLVSPPLTFSATVPIGAPTQIVNQALMVASGETTSSPQVSTLTGSPVLTIVKSNVPTASTPLVPGGLITYTIVVQNTGLGNATNVVVTDVVPTDTTYSSCSGGVTCSESGGTVTWNVGSLAPTQTATVSFTVNASSGLAISAIPYTISNHAIVDSDQTSPVDSNTVTNHLQVLPTITKSVSKAEAATGDTLTYTLEVSNPGAAFTADITDVVPTGTSFSGTGTCVPGCSLGGGTVSWSGVTVNPGTNTFSFDVTVTATGGTTVLNTGILDPTSPNLDPIPSNEVQTEIGPFLEIVKLNDPTGPVVNGNTITYTLLLSNESGVAATGVVVSDPVPVGTSYIALSCTTPAGTCGLVGSAVTWNLGNVPADGSATLTFQVTVGAPPAGTFQIANRAQVTATNSPEPVLSNFVYNALPVPEFSLTKTASPTSYSAAATVISYSYVVSNNSTTVTIVGPVTVTDDKATVTCPAGNIAPSTSMICSATYSITQADLDAGSVTNTAQAHSTTVANSNTAVATVTAGQTKSIAITKHAVLDMTVVAPAGRADAGDKINYTFDVTNTGNVTLTGVTVTDPLTGLNCTTIGTLLPSATVSASCPTSYTLLQSDIDAGSRANTATVSGTPPTGPAVTNTSNATVPLTAVPSLTIAKDADLTTVSGPGPITYTIVVTNTGNVSLTAPVVTDPFATGGPTYVSGDLDLDGAIDVGEIWTYSASYLVTQADIDAGLDLVNTATVDTDQTAPQSDDATTTVDQNASLTIAKDADLTTVSGPGPITYTIVVTNTGNVSLTAPVVTDPFATGGPTYVSGDLDLDGAIDVGEIWTYSASYLVTQADIDAGLDLVNTATVDTDQTAPQSDDATTTVDQNASLTIAKDADLTTVSGPGPITYTIVVTNTGNVSLTAPVVTDPFATGGPTYVSGDLDLDGAIDVGEIWTYSASYLVTQADLDAGLDLVNTATVDTDQTAPQSDDATTTVDQTASLTIAKDADLTTVSGPGPITYTIVVTNTGNVSLTAPVVTDPFATGGPTYVSGDLDLDGAIDVGEIWTYSASYLVTQADIDAGLDLVNTATVDTDQTAPQSDDATTTVDQNASLTIAKDADLTTVSGPGPITYTIVVTNTGNVSLTAPVVTDPFATGGPTYVSGDLDLDGAIDVGEIWTYSASYLVTQADIDAGLDLVNTATVDTDQTAPQSDDATTTVDQTASLTIAKDADLTTVSGPGPITYTIVVTNTGNVSLTAPVVTDPFATGGPTYVSGDLDLDGAIDVGEIWTYSASYLVTQADLDAGLDLVNTATVDTDQTAPQSDDATTTVDQTASLTIAKDADLTTVSGPGPITYTIVVTNTGNVSLTAPVVTDPFATGGPTYVSGDLDLDGAIDVGEIWTYSASYLVTQADLDAGLDLVNTATVDTDQTAPQSDDATTTVDQNASLTIAKDADLTTVSGPGPITYTIVVTNTGNVSLTAPVVTDPFATGGPTYVSGDLDLDGAIDVGEIWTYSASYLVTQADIDAGLDLVNTATVDTDQTAPQSDDATTTVDQTASLTIAKDADLTTVSGPGPITYTIVVTNTGNVSLTAPVVTDPFATGGPTYVSGDLDLDGAIDVGEIWTYSASYLVTQADLDAGLDLVNTATVDTDQTAPQSDDATTTVDQTASLTIAKDADLTTVSGPGPITYTIVVTNTGNVSLTAPVVTDPFATGGPTYVSGDLDLDGAIDVGEIWTYSASYLVTQADLDAGLDLVNTATVDTDQTAPQSDDATTTVDQTASLTIAKDADLTTVSGPGPITYTIVVTNTGNVSLTAPVVTDPFATGGPTYVSGDLDLDGAIDVGEIWTYSASYLVTQADLDAGLDLVNTATVDTDQTAPQSDDATTTVDQTASLTIAKDADLTTVSGPGPITYTIVVTNTGNVSLTAPVVTDPFATGGPTYVSGDLDLDGAIDVGEIWTYSASYLVTQADLDAGLDLVNTATVDTDQTAPQSDDATTTVDQNASLTIAKDADLTTVSGPGPITYTIVVTNTGNVSLTAPVVTDPFATGGPTYVSGDLDLDGAIDVGEIWTYSASYLVTQADLDAGLDLVNTATVDTDQTAPQSDDATTTVDQTASLTIAKDADLTTVSGPGPITYTIVVTNTGNVSLTAPVVTDPFATGGPTYVSGDLDLDGAIDVGEIWTYSASYLVTQADLDAGLDLVNTATVDTDQTAPQSDDATTTVDQTASLTIAKDADLTTVSGPGPITYTIVVTNTGNVSLTAPVVTDPFATGGPTYVSGDLDLDGAIDVGEIWTYSASYLVTQADLDAGLDLVNTATVDTDQTAPQSDDATTTVDQNASLTIAKDADLTTVSGPGPITYTIVVTNTGNVSLTAPVVTDPFATGGPTYVSGDLDLDGAIDVGEIWTYSASYLVTQADLDAGLDLVNTATVDTDQTAPQSDDATTTVDQNASLTIAKDADLTTVSGPGPITYTIVVTNTGNVSLTAPVVTDPFATGGPTYVSGDLDLDGAIDVGEIWTYSASYLVTQADLDAGLDLVNTATVDTDQTAPQSDDATTTVDQNASLTIAKDADLTTVSGPGPITYTIVVTNTGNVSLTAPVVTDPFATGGPTYVSGDLDLDGAIDVGEIWTYSASYLVTQADLDAGLDLVNTATVDTDQTAPQSDDATTTVDQNASLTIAKDADLTTVSGPGPITYTIVVTNTGNVSLTAPVVTDPFATGGPTYVSGDLDLDGAIDVGEIWTYSASYLVTQADLDAGLDLVNTATVDTDQTAPQSDDATTTVDQNASLTIAKDADLTTVSGPGPITYTIVVTNTGNVSLTAPVVTDPFATGGPTYVSGDLDLDGAIDVGEIWTYSASYLVTQADLDAGLDLVNTATVDTDQTAPQSDDATTTVDQNASLTIAKDADLTTVSGPGPITYTIVVTNTGNVSLTAPVVTDPFATGGPTYVSGDLDLDGAIDVGEIWTYSASYLVTQADLDAGLDLVNTATVDTDQTAPQSDDATTTVDQNASLTIAKDADLTTVSGPGPITYTIVVTNTGNVSLTAPVVTDPFATGGPTYVSGDLDLDGAIDVGEIWTYSASYLVTQADLDAGLDLVNTATVDTDQTAPQSDDATTTVDQNASLTIAKDADLTTVSGPGPITYTIVVTNTGNVSLTAPVVTDPFATGGPTYVSGDLDLDGAIDVGEIWTYSASYLVTQADLDAGLDLVNTATVDTDQTAPQSDDATTTVDQNAHFTQTKVGVLDMTVVAPADRADAGDRIDYTITLTNDGNVTLTGVTVVDTKASPLACTIDAVAATSPFTLLPGKAVACTGSYTLTQADIDTGSVHNVATGDSDQTTPTDTPNDVPLGQSAALNVVKSSTTTAITAAGQPVPYTFTVTNTGNLTLTGITVSDPNCSTAIVGPTGDTNSDGKLQTTETWTYSCVHTVSQAEIDAATGLDPQLSNTVTVDSAESGPATDSHDIPITYDPHFTQTKVGVLDMTVVAPADRADAGDRIDYTITLTNDGNVTLTGVTVVDTKASPLACTIDAVAATSPFTLLPGKAVACTGSYTLTQADIDTGSVHNVATGDSDQTTPTDTPNDVPLGQSAALNVVKSSTTTAITAAGQPVPYTFTVTNTGNLTLTGITVSDPNCSTAIVGPTGDTNSDGKLQTTETWTYSCVHTVSQAEIDAATGLDPQLSNTVTVDSAESGPATDSHDIPITYDPHFTQTKVGVLDMTVVAPADRADAGDRIDYTITLTNDGNVTLTGVTVVDTKASPLACTIDAVAATSPFTLLPGKAVACTGSYTLTQADIDTGSVHNVATGDSDQTTPTDTPNDVPLGSSADVTLVKKTNGTDNNAAPGPTIAVGSPVTWTYLVTNTGNVTLTNVVVTDDQVGAICTIPSLAPTASQTCSKGGTAVAGQYTNLGSVSATPPTGGPVTASDPDHYFGQNAAPGITLEKTADKTTVAPYEPVTYSYKVTNTGGTTLYNIVVTDDNGTPAFAGDDFTVGTIPSLTPGNSATLTATVIPVVSTVGSVNGNTVTAGAVIVVEALGSGDIKVTYLQDFGINDNTYGTGAIGWPSGHTFNNLVGSDKLEFRFFDADGNVVLDFYQDYISATSTHPSGYGSLCASGGDGSMVFGSVSNIVSCTTSLEENLNDPLNLPKKSALIVNSPTSLVSGDVVVDPIKAPGGWDWINSYTVVIKASTFGAAGFGGVTVPDQHNSPNKPGGPNGMATTPVNSTVLNTATATATTPSNDTVTATDTATVDIVVPPSSLSGFVYVDTDNDGIKESGEDGIQNVTVKLTGTTVLGAAVSLTTTTGSNGLYTFPNLGAGTYAITETQPAGYTDGKDTIGTPGGTTGNDTFTNIVLPADFDGINNNFGELPAPVNPLSVVKSSTTTTITAAGQVVPYTFTVTNSSTKNQTKVKVTDPKCTTAISKPSGDTNGDTKLQPTETWVYTCTHTVTQAEMNAGGNLSNTVTVVSTESPAATATLLIPITQTPAVSLVKKTNGTDNDAAPGPNVPIGSTVTWTYEVKNTGNVTLTALTVTDDKIAGTICTIASLAPGASSTCTKTGIAVAGPYTNTGTVTGTPPAGAPVQATNVDHYVGVVAPNQPPTAVNDTYSTKKNTVLTVAAPGILANDTDPENNPLTAILVTNASSGTLVLNANGSFTYTPANNFTGKVTFTYKANDGAADSNVATVTISVTK